MAGNVAGDMAGRHGVAKQAADQANALNGKINKLAAAANQVRQLQGQVNGTRRKIEDAERQREWVRG